MNLLFLSLMYPEDQMAVIRNKCLDKVQYQIDHTQHAILKGLRQAERSAGNVTVFNAVPVGTYPNHYTDLVLKGRCIKEKLYYECGSINLPFLKQLQRKKEAYRFILEWVQKDKENREILIYTQYLPWIKAALAVRKHCPELKITVIVTDLPGKLGLPTGRKGLAAIAEKQIGDQSLELLRECNRFILMTASMAEVLNIKQKQHMILEGIIDPDHHSDFNCNATVSEKACLYTGTLDRALGIGELVDAFKSMPEYSLWLCGTGNYTEELRKIEEDYHNIRYFGFLPREQVLELQQKATCLINPRMPDQIFTKYSFPSKTIEYLLAAKPVLCYRLEGIPNEYDSYLQYINSTSSNGIEEKVREVMGLSESERREIGRRGREMVLNKKVPLYQGNRIWNFICQSR